VVERDREFAYDLFISYAEADHAWVEGYLLDALTLAGVCCHSEAAFALGVPRVLEFERAVQQSQRTLLVLSPACLVEGFSQFTDLLAQSYGLETATWPVIPLILQDVKLPPRLAMLTALDATDPATWSQVVERLCTELQRPVPGPALRPPCPYPGMVPFSEADSGRFFGRGREIQELLECLRLHPFLTVIGPSGSGKSSLVFAGLIPALRQSGLFGPGGWLVRTMRPGGTPLTALAAALGGDPADPVQAVSALLATQPDARRLLLVVDQFEEVFTMSGQEAIPFQGALQRLAQMPHCYVVLTVRADFYPDLMASPLWHAIQAHRVEVLPLDADGLRQAIVRPAEDRDVRVYVEAALVERLVTDAAGEPGILPWVQETLVLLWEKLERRLLPLRAYEALVLPYRAYGAPPLTGLQVAMARRADVALAELTPDQQAIARRIFLCLVQFGEGRPDARRQQPVSALRFAGKDPVLLDRTLRHLTDRRLLTLSGEEKETDRKVDIAHEALIAGWPKLQQWIREGRDAEVTRRWIEKAAEEWSQHRQDSSYLFTGKRLQQAEAWAAQLEQELGTTEKAFLAASRAWVQRQRRHQALGAAAVAAVTLLVLVALSRAGQREWVRRHTGTELVPIAGGPAIIGTDDPAAEPEEQPQRTVTLLPFQIEKYEVSNAQYRACVEFGPCTKPRVADWFDDEALRDYPVVEITARQAHVYCKWLRRQLPTTVEWERAARGITGRLWPWGNDPMPAEGYEFPIDAVPVASEPETATPPPERIYHLADNVSEWVVRVPVDCDGASCHQAWDGKADSIALMGGGYDRNIDRITQVTNYSADIPDQSRGFRCAADSRP